MRPVLGFRVLVRMAQVFGAFWRLFGPFLRHGENKPHVQCSHHFYSFGRFARALGLFWANNGCFWPKTAQIWEGTSRLGATAPGRHR